MRLKSGGHDKCSSVFQTRVPLYYSSGPQRLATTLRGVAESVDQLLARDPNPNRAQAKHDAEDDPPRRAAGWSVFF